MTVVDEQTKMTPEQWADLVEYFKEREAEPSVGIPIFVDRVEGLLDGMSVSLAQDEDGLSTTTFTGVIIPKKAPMPHLFKTIKVTADTHRAIKLAAAQEGISMADWLARIVSEWAPAIEWCDSLIAKKLYLELIASTTKITTTQLPDGSYSHTFSSKQEEQ